MNTDPKEKSVDQLPMVLVESGIKGTRITATNKIAEDAGAAIGQMLNDARAACPNIHVEQGEPDIDQAWLERLGHWAMRYSPVVALDGADGLLIDIAGCDHLFGGEEALLHDLSSRLARIGLTAQAGLADTPGAAWALARFGMGKTAAPSAIAPPGAVLEATAHLPVEALRLDDRMLLLLRRLGLKQIATLRSIPRAALERRFHSREAAFSVRLRLDQIAGDIREPLVPLKETPPYRETFACAEPAIDIVAIAMALDHLLMRMESRLQREGRGARALTLTACHSDGGYDALNVLLGRATRNPAHIARLFQDRLEQIDPGFGIDLFILSVDRVEVMTETQQSMMSTDGTLQKDIIPLIDRLINRLGAEHITRLYPLESHMPERAQKIIPAGMAEAAVAWDMAIATARPFRLFEHPEPIDAIAEVPDGPPLRFTWRRLTRKVIRTRGPERIAPEWWRQMSGAQGQSLLIRANARDYFEVEDEEGTRYWLFRAGLYGEMRHGDAPQWFIHGLFG